MVGLEEGKGVTVPAQPCCFGAPCVAGSAAVSQPCGEERSGASAAAAQGQGHQQSVQAQGGSGPAARAASTDNASTEPADLVLC